jgi:hypothetical protein
MGPYAGVNYDSPYLKVNSVVMQLYMYTPTTKGKGWRWEDLSFWLSTLVSVC